MMPSAPAGEEVFGREEEEEEERMGGSEMIWPKIRYSSWGSGARWMLEGGGEVVRPYLLKEVARGQKSYVSGWSPERSTKRLRSLLFLLKG
jgi:hypothetical protein